MSGSAMCNWGFTKNHLQRAFDLGKLLGCEAKTKEELLTFLMKASPKEFAGNQDKVINDVVSSAILLFTVSCCITSDRKGHQSIAVLILN